MKQHIRLLLFFVFFVLWSTIPQNANSEGLNFICHTSDDAELNYEGIFNTGFIHNEKAIVRIMLKFVVLASPDSGPDGQDRITIYIIGKGSSSSGSKGLGSFDAYFFSTQSGEATLNVEYCDVQPIDRNGYRISGILSSDSLNPDSGCKSVRFSFTNLSMTQVKSADAFKDLGWEFLPEVFELNRKLKNNR